MKQHVQRACDRGNLGNLKTERWAMGLGAESEGKLGAGLEREVEARPCRPMDMLRILVCTWKATGGCYFMCRVV